MDEPGTAPPPQRRVPPVLIDVVLAALVAGGTLAAQAFGRPGRGEGNQLTWVDVLLAAVAVGLILVRRRWPLPILAISTLLALVTIGDVGKPLAFLGVTVIAAYNAATRTNRRTAWLAGGAAALLVYAAIVTRTDEGWLGASLGTAAWIGMATAAGDATRSRRAYVAAIEERARRAEQTREEETRRRVTEERVRIARDLHDVVAHHIAVINVHAGLAEHTLRSRPEQAESSLAHVRQAAQTVLAELATILSVLRQTGDGDAPTEPVRGLAQLGRLLDAVAATGVKVEHQQSGDARPLPAGIDLAAYRIVQEALTNAHKHGAGTADLRIEYRPEALVIDVRNPIGAQAAHPDSTGHGVNGMHERATAMGGTLTAGPDGDGRFHLHALLPTTTPPTTTPPTTTLPTSILPTATLPIATLPTATRTESAP
ncbi:MAG: two-component sensor histidine kinase [Hamadaea sp.]|nr:two-component sensor histidine kinase [Hamadaea sp.]